MYGSPKHALCALKYEPDYHLKSSKPEAHYSSVLLRKNNNNKKVWLEHSLEMPNDKTIIQIYAAEGGTQKLSH